MFSGFAEAVVREQDEIDGRLVAYVLSSSNFQEETKPLSR